LRFGDEGNPADLGVSQDVEVNIKLYGLIEQKQP